MTQRGFHALHLAWYAEANDTKLPEFSFGYYEPDPYVSTEGPYGDLQMRWIDLGDYGLAPRLEAFVDSWLVLAACLDVFAAIADSGNKSITPEKFMDVLKQLGFADLTAYESPYDTEKETP